MITITDIFAGARLVQVVATAAAIQREIDNQPCPTCGGDRLRPDYREGAACHVPWSTEGDPDD